MSQAPSMPFFVDAYLADTGHLTADEHGAYLLLLFAMWRRNGEVPDDDKDNARVTRLSAAKWRKVKERLRPFLTFENGQITQKRLKKEWDYVAEKRAKNAQNGARGGRPASSENNDIGKANGSVSVSDVETQTKANPVPVPVPVPIDQKERATAPAAAPASQPDLLEIPECLDRRGRPSDPPETPPRVTGEIIPLVPAPEREIEHAVDVYNLAADYATAEGGKWHRCENLHDTRRKKLKLRLKECGGLAGWKEAMKRAMRSDHLMGRTPRKPEFAKWAPSLDFFLQLKSFTALMEGAYDNHEGTPVQRSKNDNLLAGAALYLASLNDDDEQGRPGEAGDDAYGPSRALLAP